MTLITLTAITAFCLGVTWGGYLESRENHVGILVFLIVGLVALGALLTIAFIQL